MRTLIVDGTNLVMRSIKASGPIDPRDPESKPRVDLSIELEGERISTAGCFLFINMLSRYVRQIEPDRIVVCWDGGRSKYRSAIYPEYKGDRAERVDEEDNSYPFHMAKEFLTLNGIHHVEVPETEADDLVAAYVRAERVKQSRDIVILSGDKDFLQLVSPKITQVRPGVKPEHWGADEVVAKFGCDPFYLPMLMALTGDKIDGVPGIPGFGAKTAVKYLDKYDWSWDELIAAAKEGEDKRIAGVQDDLMRNMALVNLQLVIEPDLEGGYVPDFQVHPEMNHAVVQWLGLYGFDSILNRYQSGTLWWEPKQRKLF